MYFSCKFQCSIVASRCFICNSYYRFLVYKVGRCARRSRIDRIYMQRGLVWNSPVLATAMYVPCCHYSQLVYCSSSRTVRTYTALKDSKICYCFFLGGGGGRSDVQYGLAHNESRSGYAMKWKILALVWNRIAVLQPVVTNFTEFTYCLLYISNREIQYYV
jgi:hypothetical protein